MTADRRDRRHLMAAGLGLLVCLAQLVRLVRLRVNVERSMPSPARERLPSRFPAGTDQFVVTAAARAGAERLESVEIRGTVREQLRAEWLGGSASALALLATSESHGIRIQRVHVAAAPRGARWTLTGEPAVARGLGEMPAALRRDPLAPVKSAAPAARAVAVRPLPRESEQARQQREEREKAEAAALVETQRLDQRRREITAGVSLSATMNNGRESLALAEVAEGGRRRTVTLHRGDSILGATVAKIDDQAGLVELDIDGKTRVNLRVPGSRAP